MVEREQHPLIARWRWLASLAVIGGIVAFAYTAWIPAKHRVRAQVMLLPTANDLLAYSPILSGNTATPLTVLQGMFDSDAMARELSDQFKISEDTLRGIWFVRSDQTTNQLEVIADATSQEQARQIVEFSISKAREFELRANESTAGRREMQLAASLKAQQKRNEQAEFELVKFLEETSTTAWDGQGILQSIASAEANQVQLSLLKTQRAQIYSKIQKNLANGALPKDAKLDELRQKALTAKKEYTDGHSELGPESPLLGQLQSKFEVADNLYRRELQRARLAANAGLQGELADLDAQIAGLQYLVRREGNLIEQGPAEQSVLQQRIRKLRETFATTTDLRAKYEQARIDAEVERVNWAVITPAFSEEQPINKRWARNPAAGAVLGLLFGAILAFSVPTKARRRKEKVQCQTAA
ncbi:MAG: hypothetical protein JNK63_00380 [Chthonomonas sp.]|nr:hypothetical protein [Chthonomonas sp.]